jgi:hypothetical protein
VLPVRPPSPDPALLGRWFTSTLMRRDRLDAAAPLSIDAPTPGGVPVIEHAPRVVLSIVGTLAWWLS